MLCRYSILFFAYTQSQVNFRYCIDLTDSSGCIFTSISSSTPISVTPATPTIPNSFSAANRKQSANIIVLLYHYQVWDVIVLEIMKTILLCSLSYFVIVFLAGFVLGVFRVLLLAPGLGERYAELAEMPLMLIVIYLAARLIVFRFSALPHLSGYLTVGLFAVALLLLIEFTLVLGLRDITIADYLASRDPVSGTAYAVSLVLYLLMPFIIAKKKARDKG